MVITNTVTTSLDAVVRDYAFPDVHIGGSESESPWVPFKDNSAIRHLAFDVRTNMYANVLWVKQGGMLGADPPNSKMIWVSEVQVFRHCEEVANVS